MRRYSGSLPLILLLLAGLVIGGFIGEWLSAYPSFSFLNYGKTFGLTSPVVLDLNVLVVKLAVIVIY